MRVQIDGFRLTLVPECDLDAGLMAAFIACTKNGGRIAIHPNGIDHAFNCKFPPAADNKDRLTVQPGTAAEIRPLVRQQ